LTGEPGGKALWFRHNRNSQDNFLKIQCQRTASAGGNHEVLAHLFFGEKTLDFTQDSNRLSERGFGTARNEIT
jgi:hypothetical protein